MKNSLESKYPKLAKEFQVVLNKTTADNISADSQSKYYWKCQNKHCGKCYKATIKQRIANSVKCSKCEERRVSRNETILKNQNPILLELESIKKEFDSIEVNLKNLLGKNKVKVSSDRIRTSLNKFNNFFKKTKKTIKDSKEFKWSYENRQEYEIELSYEDEYYFFRDNFIEDQEQKKDSI